MRDWIERHSWEILLTLLVIDLATLVVAGFLTLHQNTAIDRANDAALSAKHAAHQSHHAVKVVKVRVCRNSEALIETNKRQIAGYNRQLAQLDPAYIVTVLGVDQATAETIVAQQTKQYNQGKASAYRAIHDLSKNCA